MQADVARRRRAWWTGAAIVVAAATPVFFLGLDQPGLFDNEGRYAEVGREMVVLGDWTIPRLNSHTFLNKPPLLYWLAAAYFQVVGFDEGVRVWPALAALLTVLVTYAFAVILRGVRCGVLAVVVLGSSIGFFLEARTLRPDMLLTLGVWIALLCAVQSERSPGHQRAWMLGSYAGMGLAVLAKGFLGVLLPALPIGAVALWRDGWRGLRALHLPLGTLVLAAIIIPWHAAAAIRVPGFLWDYVVHQHVLFFFDQKVPRDSEGDTLLFFWAAFVLRAFPWSIFLPLALVRGLSAPRRPDATPMVLVHVFVWGGCCFSLWRRPVSSITVSLPFRVPRYLSALCGMTA